MTINLKMKFFKFSWKSRNDQCWESLEIILILDQPSKMQLVLEFLKIRYFTFGKIISRDLSQKRINLGLEKMVWFLDFVKMKSWLSWTSCFARSNHSLDFQLQPLQPAVNSFFFLIRKKSPLFKVISKFSRTIGCPDDPDLRFI